MKTTSKNRPPVMKTMCETCPFRKDSEYAYLAPHLAKECLTDHSRICHSTGKNGINKNTGKPDRFCRGARDVQLKFFVSMGFLTEATDEAWAAKLKELGQ